MTTSRTKTVLAALAASWLTACVPAYTLVEPGPSAVGNGAMSVTPARAWNGVPVAMQQPEWEESWTANGPLLDTIVFVSGLPEGKSLLRQRQKDDAQVPVFRADMTPNDLVSMIESSYRVGGVAVFHIDQVDTTPFLGGTGIRMRYHYSPGEGIGRKGSCVLRAVDKKLYLMKLEGVASHYFDQALPEFDQMVASATLEQ
jgi:hypothetical protein